MTEGNRHMLNCTYQVHMFWRVDVKSNSYSLKSAIGELCTVGLSV